MSEELWIDQQVEHCVGVRGQLREHAVENGHHPTLFRERQERRVIGVEQLAQHCRGERHREASPRHHFANGCGVACLGEESSTELIVVPNPFEHRSAGVIEDGVVAVACICELVVLESRPQEIEANHLFDQLVIGHREEGVRRVAAENEPAIEPMSDVRGERSEKSAGSVGPGDHRVTLLNVGDQRHPFLFEAVLRPSDRGDCCGG